jgi:DNA-binding NtrC family response regulator
MDRVTCRIATWDDPGTARAGPANERVMSDKKNRAGPAAAAGTALILEAEDMVRRLLINQLTVLGFKTIEASEPALAREILRKAESSIDLLVTGAAVMRACDGAAFAGEARRSYPAMAVLVVAGYVDSRVEATLAGEGIRVLIKPFRMKELARSVRAAMADRDKDG